MLREVERWNQPGDVHEAVGANGSTHLEPVGAGDEVGLNLKWPRFGRVVWVREQSGFGIGGAETVEGEAIGRRRRRAKRNNYHHAFSLSTQYRPLDKNVIFITCDCFIFSKHKNDTFVCTKLISLFCNTFNWLFSWEIFLCFKKTNN